MLLSRPLLVVLFTLKKTGATTLQQLAEAICNCEVLTNDRIEILLDFWIKKGIVSHKDGNYFLESDKSNLLEALLVNQQLIVSKNRKKKVRKALRQLNCKSEITTIKSSVSNHPNVTSKILTNTSPNTF